MNKNLLILCMTLFISACTLSESFTLHELQNLEEIDRIEIFFDNYPNSYIIKTTNDPEQVDLIVQTFRQYANGWKNYIPTPPHSPISINFYSGNQYRFGVGIGYTDQTSSKKKIFYLSQSFGREGKPLTEGEFKELMQILGVEENLAYYE